MCGLVLVWMSDFKSCTNCFTSLQQKLLDKSELKNKILFRVLISIHHEAGSAIDGWNNRQILLTS